MEVVLQFLYTGKLKLRADIIKPVRELLQRILKIDADFKLPTDEAINGLQNGNSRKDRDGDSGKGKIFIYSIRVLLKDFLGQHFDSS